MRNSSKLDLTYLKSISAGDDLFIVQMLDLFLVSIPDEAQKMINYYHKKEYVLMGKSAHKMKATIQMIGEDSLAELVIKIEQIGKTTIGIGDLPGIMNELASYLDDILEKIKVAKKGLITAQN